MNTKLCILFYNLFCFYFPLCLFMWLNTTPFHSFYYCIMCCTVLPCHKLLSLPFGDIARVSNTCFNKDVTIVIVWIIFCKTWDFFFRVLTHEWNLDAAYVLFVFNKYWQMIFLTMLKTFWRNFKDYFFLHNFLNTWYCQTHDFSLWFFCFNLHLLLGRLTEISICLLDTKFSTSVYCLLISFANFLFS